jgi:hypothetical protein
MVIYDHVKFRFVTQIFLLLALIAGFTAIYIIKLRKTEITNKIVLRILMLITMPIIAFPFIFLSTLSLLDKLIATLIAISGVLLQFYGTISFRKMLKKSSTPSDRV